MQVTIRQPVNYDVKYLVANLGVRYWEDATVNGVDDQDGTLIPLRSGDSWIITIDLDTGIIQDWPEGTTAKTHYKVCDAGTYALLTADLTRVLQKEGYVPSLLAPGGGGYGDYVILEINGSGQIEQWRADLSDLLDSDD